MVLDTDSWQEIWGTISRNRLRTALTALGVFWGVFMLIVMVGSGNGLERGVHRTMAGVAANSIFMWGEVTSKAHDGLQPGRLIRFKTGDVPALSQLAGIEHLAPRNQLGGWRQRNNIVRGEKSGVFSVFGDYPVIHRIQTVLLDQGRYLNDLDLQENRKVAFIGARVRDELFAEGEEPIGELIQVQGVQFRIIGVFRSQQTGDHGERQESAVQVPFTTFARTFNTGDRVHWFAMTVKPGFTSSEVEKRVRAVLNSRHRAAPDDDEAIGSFDAEKEFSKVHALFLGIRTLIWVVGVLTLLAGVVGVSNIMLISVKERTKEIGVRKAVGATPGRVVAQILQEAVALTSLSGYVGLVLGVAVLEVVRRLLDAAKEMGQAPTMFDNPGVDFGVALIAAAVLVVAGALAGAIPANAAARIQPAVALRAE